MLNLQEQSGRPKTVLQEPCAVNHDETLHVSTTAYMEHISTQATMLYGNSVQETETPITTLVENNQADLPTGPASTILSTVSSMKLRDIIDKMRSCLFGWSWRQVSLFDLTGKHTDTAKPTVHIPCTAIVPVSVQELFFPCSLLEATTSCNQEKVEESTAIPPHDQVSLAELELRLQLPGICDIAARLCVIFRPECIVEVDCTILNFQAIADGMREIGLPLPTRAIAYTLANMASLSSAVQVAATSEVDPVGCDNYEMALDVTHQETIDVTALEHQDVVVSQPDLKQLTEVHDDACGNFELKYDQELEALMVIPSQPSRAELELCLQLPGIYDITAHLCVLFRPECIVEVDFTILNFETIADGVREIDLQLPIEAIANSLGIIPLHSSAASEVQAFDRCNYEIMALDISQQETQQEEDHEVQAAEGQNLDTATDVPTLDLHDVVVNQPEESLMVQDGGCDNHETPTEVPTLSQMSESITHDGISAVQTMDDQEVVVIDQENLPEDSLEVRVAENNQEALEPLAILPQRSVTELELRLQLPGICDVTAHLYVVFRPECIVEVNCTILNVEAIADGVREIDLQLPIGSIANALAIMPLQPSAVQDAATPEVQPVDCDNYKMSHDVAHQETQQVEEQEPKLLDEAQEETDEKHPVCSKFASISRQDASSVASDVSSGKSEETLRGAEIFFGKMVKREGEDQCAERVSSVKVLPTPSDHFLAVLHEIYHLPSDVANTPEAEVETAVTDGNNNKMTSNTQAPNQSEVTMDTTPNNYKRQKCSDQWEWSSYSELDEDIFVRPENSYRRKPKPATQFELVSVLAHQDGEEQNENQEFHHSLAVGVEISPLALSSEVVVVAVREEAYVNDNMPVLTESVAPAAEVTENTRCELISQSVELVKESEEVLAIKSTERLKPLEDVTYQNAECHQTNAEGVQRQESVNEMSSEGIQHQDDVNASIPETPVEEKPTAAEHVQTVTECTMPNPSVEEHIVNVVAVLSDEQVQASDSVRTVCHETPKEDAQQTSNTIAEVVTRDIKEIESVDNNAKVIEDVTLGGINQRRRKRKYADDDNQNQLLSKDVQVDKINAQDLGKLVGDKRMSHLNTDSSQRYPSDVHQALMTQTVDLLERGIVLLSDDGSFKAVVNPNSASRIASALTEHNFSSYYKRYENDVLPQDLKQRLIDRAALVARDHQDRALEGLAERPIFTLSDIRHYDCNGDYIMEDVSSPNIPVYPFTGIQQTPFHHCFVNPFQTSITPQGLLTAGIHIPFQMMSQQNQYDIEMIDVDELYMDIDESIEDMFMECEDNTDCSYCSQISLNLLASLPTKYAISRRAIYSLLDERPLNPEIPSSGLKEGSKKSWFAYNTFSFRPEYDEPSGCLSRKDRVIYSLLDERSLNPVLSPSLERQSKVKSWLAYNTFSFKEGSLMPLGTKCNCMEKTEIPFQTASQAANIVPSAVQPWPKLDQNTNSVFSFTPEQNTIASKSSFNTFSFRPEDHISQQTSILGESKQESVFSFGKAERLVTPAAEPLTVSSGLSWKYFSFREEDDPKQTPFLGKNKQRLTFSPVQAEADESSDTNQQATDLSLEPAEQAVNKKTLTFSLGQEKQPAFPVSEDNDSTSNETESQDDDLFDLNDENKELAIKEIIAAVKSQLNERNINIPEECVAQILSSEEGCDATGESVKDSEIPSKIETATKQAFANGQNVELKTIPEANDKVDKTLMNATGQSQATNNDSQDARQHLLEARVQNTAEPSRKPTISHSKSINNRSKPYPTQAASGMAAFLRRVKVVKRDRLRTLQISTQVSQGDNDADSTKPVPALPQTVQQREVVSLKSLIGNTKHHPSSKSDLSITIAPSDAEERKVVSWTRNKKEPDVKGSEMNLLKSRTQSKDADGLSKLTSSTLSGSGAANKRVSFAQSETPERTTSYMASPPTVTTKSYVAEKRNKVISLRSVIQSKKADPISKPFSPDSHVGSIQGASMKPLNQTMRSEQISKANLEEGNSKPAPLKSPTPSLTADSMSNSISHLPLVSSVEENNEVVSLNPLPKGTNTEASSTSIHSVVPASSGVQNTKVLSLKPLNQNTCKKDEQVKKSVPSLKQVSFDVEDSKESSGLVKSKVVSSTSSITTQCKKIDLSKEPVLSAQPVSSSKVKPSSKKDSVNSSGQPKTANPLKESSPSKSLSVVKVEKSRMVSLKSLTRGSKSDPMKKVVSSPQVSTVAESSARKVTFKSTNVEGKEIVSNKSSSSKAQVSNDKKGKMVVMETASHDSCVADPGSAKEVMLGPTSQKKNLTKSATSTKAVSCKRDTKMLSLTSVLQSETENGLLSKVALSKSPSSCDDRKVETSELMSLQSVTKSEKAVPVNTSPVTVKVKNNLALTPSKIAHVKNDGSADGQLSIAEPSNSGKRKSFQSLTSSHKRELDEMLEEDQQSNIERLRQFNSRRRKPTSGIRRKTDVKLKSVSNSDGADCNKDSEANKNVKLVKTDVVQDTSVAKRSLATTKRLEPISLTVDVNTVKDGKNESIPKWIPGTLEKTKPSPEERVTVPDVPKHNSSSQSSQGTSQEFNLTPLIAVKTNDVNASGGSAMSMSPAVPNPKPLLRAVAEGKTANTGDKIVAQSSQSMITPTRTEPLLLYDTETVSKDASNTTESNMAKDSSEKSCLPQPEQRSSSMDLVKEPLCLAGVVAIFGENKANSEQMPEPLPVPQPVAEHVTLGKRKLRDMQDEDEKIPTCVEKEAGEVRKKRCWRTVDKTPENHEQPNKPRRLVRNTFRKG